MKQNNYKQDIIRILLIALTAFYCILPLYINKGLPYAHDIIFHIFQADQFNRAIHDGFLYPHWVLDSNNGYGSASFVFYSPLSYYLVAVINIFTPSIIVSMVVALWCGIFFSGLTMFFATRKIYGRSVGSLPSVIYQILPFHLWNIYIRGTFAELFAYIWFPLIILFLYKTVESKENNKTAIIGLEITYAGLILTHLVSGFIFSFVIGAYLIYSYVFLQNKKKLFRPIFSLAHGLGLSSIYLLPVVFERKFVQIEYIVTCPVGNYKKNFLFTWDKVQTVLRNFYLPIHIGVLLEVFLFICIILLIQRNKDRLSFGYIQRFLIFLFIAAFFLTTPLSKPIWDITPGFPFLQFPWRWIPMMEFPLCILIGAFFSSKNISRLKPSMLRRATIYIILMLSLVSFITIVKSKVIPEASILKFMSPERVKHIIDPPLEYTPIWVKDIEPIMAERKDKKISVASGSAQIHVIVWKSERRVISIKASEPSLIRISTFYFPGWKAYIDNTEAEIHIEKGTGAMLVNIPKGEYRLILRFEDTPIRYYAKLISLLSFGSMLLFIFFIRKKSK